MYQHEVEEGFELLLSKFTAKKLRSFYVAQPGQPDSFRSKLKKHSIGNLFPPPPTVEKFLDVPARIRKLKFFQSISIGDVVEGRVTEKWADELYIRLNSIYYGPKRWIKDLQIKVECDLSEFKTHSGTRRLSDSISDFDIGDLVRGVVCNVNEASFKIAISFRRGLLPDELSHIELGAVETQHESWDSDNDDSYIENLRSNPCFANPESVNNLVTELGIAVNKPSTFIEKCLCEVDADEYGEKLRDRQSTKWSMEMVANGVKLFKESKHEEAMKCFDQALQMHATNVEAIVARGALKANQNLLKGAVEDFYKALEIQPSHRNGQKYLCETLITLAKQCEKDRLWKDASRRYKEVLQLNPEHAEAVDRFHEIQLIISQQVLAGKRTSMPAAAISLKPVDTALPSEKPNSKSLKELLRDKIRKKARKGKRSRSRSSRKKDKKKKRKKMKTSLSKYASSSDSSETDPDGTDSASEKPNSNTDDEWVEKVVEERRTDSSAFKSISDSDRKAASLKRRSNYEGKHASQPDQYVERYKELEDEERRCYKPDRESAALGIAPRPDRCYPNLTEGVEGKGSKDPTETSKFKNRADVSFEKSVVSKKTLQSDEEAGKYQTYGQSFRSNASTRRSSHNDSYSQATTSSSSNDTNNRAHSSSDSKGTKTHALTETDASNTSKALGDVRSRTVKSGDDIDSLISYGRYGHTKDSYNKVAERNKSAANIPTDKIKNKHFSSDEIGFISQLLSKKHSE